LFASNKLLPTVNFQLPTANRHLLAKKSNFFMAPTAS